MSSATKKGFKSNREQHLLAMPQEVLSTILEYLPIQDCRTMLQILKENPFSGPYNDRISPELYFTKNFYDGNTIMNILRVTDAYLYGSRATEYFVPGSAVYSSDWNFCLPRDDKKIYHFLMYMEKIGVSWQSNMLFLMANRNNFVTSAIKFRKVINLYNISKRDGIDSILSSLDELEASGIDADQKFILAIYSYIDSQYCYYILDSRIEIHNALKEYRNLVNDADSFIVNGTLEKGNIKSKIKVHCFNHAAANHIRYLIYSPVTASQCFISGFAAGHMYGNLTAERKIHTWTTSKSIVDNFSLNLTDVYGYKYRDREYLIKPKTLIYVLLRKLTSQRSLLDNASTIIKFEPADGWNYNNWIIVQDSFCSLTWTEDSKDMKISSPHPYFGSLQYPNILQYSTFRQSLFEFELDYSYLRFYGLVRE